MEMVENKLNVTNTTRRVMWKVLAQIQPDWRLTEEELCRAIGGLNDEFVSQQMSGRTDPVPDETVLCVSHLMTIYRCLTDIFPNREQANTWIDRPNSAELFNGRPARAVILAGDLEVLAQVSRYLLAARG